MKIKSRSQIWKTIILYHVYDNLYSEYKEFSKLNNKKTIQEEKGTAEDEMFGWHHQPDGHEFEQALGVGDGQRSLVCYSPWGCKESNTTEWLNWIQSKKMGKGFELTLHQGRYIKENMWRKKWSVSLVIRGM